MLKNFSSFCIVFQQIRPILGLFRYGKFELFEGILTIYQKNGSIIREEQPSIISGPEFGS
jgi:hypothetical protein